MSMDICVVTHNSLDDLKRFLEVLHSDWKPFVWQLYIADNGSTDGTVEWLNENSQEYDIQGIMFNENVGYSMACNHLATIGDSPIIALCNADIWLQTADAEAMLQSFAETGADILGPKQRDEKGLIRHGGIFGTNERPKFRGWAEYDPSDVAYRDRVEAVTVSGSAYFIKRSVWNSLTDDAEYRKLVPEAVGAFLPTPMFYEETWCSYFARHRGYKVMYDGSVSIGHTWHSTLGKAENRANRDKWVQESRAMFRTACDFHGIERD